MNGFLIANKPTGMTSSNLVVFVRRRLPKGTAIPSTREQLAVLLWSTAGKPEPAAPAVYSDVAEPDTAKAARWAVEAGLLPDMGEGVFTPGKHVTKVQVIRAWSQLKKLGLAK